jgi:DNA-binding transcriptional LysR family regulator
MYCDGPTAIKAAVAQQMGVGMMFAESLKADVDAGKFKILEVPRLNLVGESYIIYSQSRLMSPLTREFLALLRCAVAEQPSTAGSRIRQRSTSARHRPVVAADRLAQQPR